MNLLVKIQKNNIESFTVMLTSLMAIDSKIHYKIYVLSEEVDGMDLKTIKSRLPYKRCQFIPINSSKNSFLESLPKDVKRLLYLEADLVVIQSLKILYEMDLKGYLFAAVHQNTSLNCQSGEGPFNRGVVLIDVEGIRKEKNKKDVFREDQILPIDSIKYNFCDRTYMMHRFNFIKEGKIDLSWVAKNVFIIRYRGKNKPWREDYNGYLGLFYQKYAQMLLPDTTSKNSVKQKVLMLINPYAGRGTIKEHLLEIIRLFNKFNYEVRVHITQRANDIPMMIETEAKKYDLLVVSGGDGTLNESVTGLMKHQIDRPLGYLPAGSMNDFASSLGIPKDVMEAARVIVEGKEFRCDVGRFNQQYFTYIAAFGAFTEVSYQTPQTIKNMIGKAAYFLEGVGSLPFIRSYKLKLNYEDKVIEDEFIFGMISNSLSVAGVSVNNGLDVALNDEMLEVLLIKKPKNPFELQAMLGALLKQELNKNYFYVFKTNYLEFESIDEIPWTLDGEFGGVVSKGIIEVNPQPLRIKVQ